MLNPALVVVPASTLGNWQREFATWCPALKVLIYKGEKATRNREARRILRGAVTFDVLIMSYSCVASTDADWVVLKQFEWSHLVLDEAHCFKVRGTS